MKKNIYFLGLLLLAACANDDEPTGQQVPNAYPLTIEVTENPLIPDGEDGSSTRAAITTKSSLNGFNMNYVYGTPPNSDSMTATKDGDGKWNCNGGWPGGSATINWYAYTDGTFNLNEGDPYINFMVEESATNQKDLLVAKLTDKTWNNCGGNLNFTFDHACAAVRFYVKKASNLGEHSLTVSSIVLKNVVKHGKYYYDTDTGYWKLITAEASDFTDYTLYSGNDKTITSSYTCLNGTNEDNSYLFLIPQALTAWDSSTTTIAEATTQTYLKVKCTITKTSVNPNKVIYNDSYAYIPFGATLVAGKKYDVKINVGKNSLYSDANTIIITE